VCLKPSYVSYFDRHDVCMLKSWSDWRSYIGKVVYAVQVLQIPMCRIFLLLKLLAKHATTQPNANINVSESVRQLCGSMNQIISHNAPRQVFEESVDTKILVTDAALSTSMWGAVLLTAGKTYVASGPLSTSFQVPSINVAELEAVKCAVDIFTIRDPTLRVLTDNSSTLFWLKQTWSPVFVANAMLQSIFAKVGRIFPLYVPSALNPADPPSRDEPPQDHHGQFVEFLRRTAFAVCWGGGGWTLGRDTPNPNHR
jgi:hypothetical protein